MSSITHSIISWDCSFRNFFHTIDGILNQDYDLSKVELIFVEQRSKKYAEKYNRQYGLKTLSDRFIELKNSQLNFYVEYLNDPLYNPYHLGKCNNKGIMKAKGDIVSVMDGDMLLPDNFLNNLEEYHSNNAGVVNLVRRMAEKPVNASFDNWTKAVFDYKSCFEVCSDRNKPIPRQVSNKGPMISALNDDWNKVSGYDLHELWSTGLSRLGQDVNARLEIITGKESSTLPETVAVHPYHPAGFSRITLNSVRFLAIQENIIQWTIKHKIYDWNKRQDIMEKIYNKHSSLIRSTIDSKLSRPDKGKWDGLSTFSSSEILGKIYRRLRKLIRIIPVEMRV